MVSDEYIRMCKEATEIQEAWDPKEGDLIVWDFDGNFKQDLLRLKKASKQDLQDLDVFWLPRQEDLQEFSLNNGDLQRITDYTNTFCKFIKKQHKEVTGYNNSWSKLWLLFVMETVYNKTWTGNGWVKQ